MDASKSLATAYPKIHRTARAQRRNELRRAVILLLGNERIDHGGVLVSVAIVFIVLMRHGMILDFVTGGGVRSVAMIHLSDMLYAAAVTHKTAMHSKCLRPAHREQRDEAKSEALKTKKRHNGQMITSL